MGAESSSYHGLQLEEELPLTGDKGWSIHDAQTKDGSRVSVFLHNKSTANSDLLQNAAKVSVTVGLEKLNGCGIEVINVLSYTFIVPCPEVINGRDGGPCL